MCVDRNFKLRWNLKNILPSIHNPVSYILKLYIYLVLYQITMWSPSKALVHFYVVACHNFE